MKFSQSIAKILQTENLDRRKSSRVFVSPSCMHRPQIKKKKKKKNSFLAAFSHSQLPHLLKIFAPSVLFLFCFVFLPLHLLPSFIIFYGFFCFFFLFLFLFFDEDKGEGKPQFCLPSLQSSLPSLKVCLPSLQKSG